MHQYITSPKSKRQDKKTNVVIRKKKECTQKEGWEEERRWHMACDFPRHLKHNIDRLQCKSTRNTAYSISIASGPFLSLQEPKLDPAHKRGVYSCFTVSACHAAKQKCKVAQQHSFLHLFSPKGCQVKLLLIVKLKVRDNYIML